MIAFPGGILQLGDFVYIMNAATLSVSTKGKAETFISVVKDQARKHPAKTLLWLGAKAYRLFKTSLLGPLAHLPFIKYLFYTPVDIVIDYANKTGYFDELNSAFGSLFAYAVATLFGLFVGLFYLVAALLSVLRLFISLIKIYLMMALDIIFAPLTFILGVIPGNEAAYQNWFKRMLTRSLAPMLAYFLVNLGILLVLMPIILLAKKGNPGVPIISLITGGILDMQLRGVKEFIVVLLNVPIIILLVLLNMASQAEELLSQMFGIQAGALGKAGAAAISKVPIIGRFAKSG